MIGIIGGYGAVGTQAARLLAAWGAGPLRIGARDGERAALLAADLGPGAEAARVDVGDDASLAAFVDGCALVVHCAGPSHRTAVRVARAALAAGAHHVDAGAAEGLDTLAATGRAAVFAAGALPGLSGLLPRWLARQDFAEVHRLTAHAAVLDAFTATGAEDYLHGVLGDDSEPSAAWADGARRPGALARAAGQRLPYLPRPVTVLPYLDGEGERVARDLGLDHGRWFTALDGEHLTAALDAARTLDRADAVTALCRATALDLAGRSPYAVLLAQLDGVAWGRTVSRTAVLRAPGISELTGAATAVAALAVLRGEVPPGVHRADAVLDPLMAVARLRRVPGVVLTVADGTAAELAVEEEGAL
ncbi:saccharopine dehydrogenase NADP-binding domain-containing protein [Streptomyces sp. NRRL WC-3742]|uniref:saccharopine dehydrogenase NADP-binding domain-containing protein n=1 Tax=Streptomyces sp. NRRL WC-3742 TaxID=1463934 RepID=UPI0004C92DFB|nr:saccharopine dehydrogenase NADP-binding domain-containing protein [Streptomyces sp. NRRL WC-3742]